jgi:sorting nexin-1/2
MLNTEENIEEILINNHNYHQNNQNNKEEKEEEEEEEKEEKEISTNNNENKKIYFNIQVTTSEKVNEGIINSHVIYTIEGKTNHPEYKKKDINCTRRYSDFIWLREKLLENYKGYLIPPLPEKALLNRFNNEFIEYRRRELEKFLKRIVIHPILSNSIHLKSFLENSEILNSKTNKKNTVGNENTEKKFTGGLFSFIGSSIEGISGINFNYQNEPDQWFDAKKNYINLLENNLSSLLKIFSLIIKKKKELIQISSEFGTVCSLLSSSEADHDQYVSNNFQKLSEISQQISTLDDKRINNEILFFEDSIRDYLRILSSVKEMLDARNEKLSIYQNYSKQYESKEEKYKKTKNLQKNEKELEELKQKENHAKEEFEKISEVVKLELQKFEETKKEDFKIIFEKLSQINIDYQLQAIDQWKIFLNELTTQS